MKNHKDQRERILLLATILSEESDSTHPLSLGTLIEKLHEREAGGERKSIYKDLAALQKYGMEVTYQAGKFGGWYLKKKVFTLEQVILIQDAIGVYPYMSQEERREISEGLRSLLPAHRRDKLKRPVKLMREPCKTEESVQRLLGDIYRGIQEEQLLNFTIYEYDCEKNILSKLRHSMVPHGVLWEDSKYYLYGWEGAEEEVTFHNLDRMRDILKLGPHGGERVLNWNIYMETNFGHKVNKSERVYFYCTQNATDEVLRQFGEDVVLKREKDGFTFSARVEVNFAFWGFMVSHCEQMTIISPSWRVKEWRDQYRPRIDTVLIDPQEKSRFLMSL